MYNNMNSPKDIAKKVLADILSSPQYGFQKFSKSNTPDIQNPGLNSSRYMSMLAELKERRMNMAAEAKKLQDENRKQSLEAQKAQMNAVPQPQSPVNTWINNTKNFAGMANTVLGQAANPFGTPPKSPNTFNNGPMAQSQPPQPIR